MANADGVQRCCGINFGCASGVVYVEPLSQAPRTCYAQSQVSTCPPGYLCQPSTVTGQLVCCSSVYPGLTSGTLSVQPCKSLTRVN